MMNRIVYRNDDPPDYPEGPCDVCGKTVDNCICPECPNCETTGDPNCYRPDSYCGLVKSQRQIDSYAEAEANWKAEAEAENRYAEELLVPATMDKRFTVWFKDKNGDLQWTGLKASDVANAYYQFKENIGLPIVRIDMEVARYEEKPGELLTY